MAKQADPVEPPAVEPPAVELPAAEPPAEPETKNVLTTTQWLSVISIVVSLVGIYYKREQIKNVFAKKGPPPSPAREPPPVDAAPKSAIRKMD